LIKTPIKNKEVKRKV